MAKKEESPKDARNIKAVAGHSPQKEPAPRHVARRICLEKIRDVFLGRS
jgi:hypothetical protein